MKRFKALAGELHARALARQAQPQQQPQQTAAGESSRATAAAAAVTDGLDSSGQQDVSAPAAQTETGASDRQAKHHNALVPVSRGSSLEI